jgi:hypothetical protein
MNMRIVGLGVACAALGAVLVTRPEFKAAMVGAANLVGVSLTPANSNVETGPSYLISNQPWIFGQPPTAVLASVSQQTYGGTAGIIPQFNSLTKTY